MRKRLLGTIIAILALTTMVICITAAPVEALPASQCNIGSQLWVNATDGSPASWGRVRWCVGYDNTGSDQGYYPLFQVDDTLTDGYAVHLEFLDSTGATFHATGNGTACDDVQSVGPIVQSCWSSSTWAYYGGNHLWVRLIKGRSGLAGDGGHQNAGMWEFGGWWFII